MDRSERYGSYEQDFGTSGIERPSDSGYYRQSYEYQRAQGAGSSLEWASVAMGALLVGVGGYLLTQGLRGNTPSLPFGGHGSEGSATEMASRQRAERMSSLTKGNRDTPGIQVREQVTVNRSVPELFRFWRNIENLPRVMTYLEDVTKSGERRSHWVAKGPAGQKIEWDAEITDARENELVAWRSLEGSEVPNEGSVRFSRNANGNGTVVDVALTYHPPGGKAGAAVAKLFGREPAQEIRRDLERFKERVESGNLILATGSYGGPYTG